MTGNPTQRETCERVVEEFSTNGVIWPSDKTPVKE